MGKEIVVSRDFKGIWISKDIWIDNDLSSLDKCLLAEIDSLSIDGKGCFASNDYLSKFFGVSKDRISRIISSLVKKGKVIHKLIYKKGSKEVEKRLLFVNYNNLSLNKPIGIGDFNETPIGENTQDIIKNSYNKEYNCLVSNEQKTKKEEETKKNVLELFEFWNNLNIKNHRVLNSSMEKLLKQKLKFNSLKEIKQCMENYCLILKGNEYFFNYAWSLNDFLKRKNGFDSWIEYSLKELQQNYKNKTIGYNNPQIQMQDKQKRKVMF